LEEAGRLLVLREGEEGGELIRGEGIRGDIVAWEAGVDELDVDADEVAAGDGDGCEIAGVGDVELPVGDMGEDGLPVGLRAEEDDPGRNAEVAAEDEAEAGAAGDEAGLVALE